MVLRKLIHSNARYKRLDFVKFSFFLLSLYMGQGFLDNILKFPEMGYYYFHCFFSETFQIVTEQNGTEIFTSNFVHKILCIYWYRGLEKLYMKIEI